MQLLRPLHRAVALASRHRLAKLHRGFVDPRGDAALFSALQSVILAASRLITGDRDAVTGDAQLRVWTPRIEDCADA